MRSEEAILGVVGAGGMGREAMAFVREPLRGVGIEAIFVDDAFAGIEIHGNSCISENDFFARRAEKHFFNVAVGDSRVRQAAARRLIAHGAVPYSLIHESVWVGANVRIGRGALVCPNSTLSADIDVGAFFQCNINSHVAHDCVIGDFVTFAPGVHCNGNVHIGDHAYVGSAAIIRNGSPTKPLRIGEGAVVGMGAVVTKDVRPHTTVVGNPARLLVKQAKGW